MKLINDYSWNRRDFYFDAECEGCGNVMKKLSGYDDANYYENVIPNIKCDKCGKSAKELNVPIEPEKPYYDPNIVM